jgi:hypothetical protein
MRCGQRRTPPHHQSGLDCSVDPPHKLRLMLAPGGRNQRTQQSLVNDEELMLIEPAARKSEQLLAIIRAIKLLAQHTNERDGDGQ